MEAPNGRGRVKRWGLVVEVARMSTVAWRSQGASSAAIAHSPSSGQSSGKEWSENARSVQRRVGCTKGGVREMRLGVGLPGGDRGSREGLASCRTGEQPGGQHPDRCARGAMPC